MIFYFLFKRQEFIGGGKKFPQKELSGQEGEKAQAEITMGGAAEKPEKAEARAHEGNWRTKDRRRVSQLCARG